MIKNLISEIKRKKITHIFKYITTLGKKAYDYNRFAKKLTSNDNQKCLCNEIDYKYY